jgi:hypothetical protein
MTPDEIIVLANKAGWDVLDLDDGFGIRLKEFAALVEEKATAKEREACAKLVAGLPAPDIYSLSDQCMWDVTCVDCADAIRARGQT